MRFTIWALLPLLWSWHGSAAAETWAEKLGYPPEKRVLILHADHMGAAYETNRAGQKLLSEGLVQSAGVMVPCPWFTDFAEWCRSHGDCDVGICLTLNSPSRACRWRPLLGPMESGSLIDADGYFWATPHQVAARADTEEVARELSQQVERARAAGIQPTHLLPAMGSLFMRPDLLEVYLQIAERYWIPAVVVELTPEHIQRFQQEGFPFTEQTQDLMRSYPLPKLDEVRFLPDADSYAAKRDALVKLVQELPPGLCQITFGPAEASDALAAITPRWQQLVWDAKLLQDPLVRALFQSEGVQLTNWKEVMRRFRESTASSIR